MDPSKKPYKILIVDDTPENIDILADILKSEYQRVVALNGARALEIAGSESPPDLVLLDIMMPEMDGYEVCRRLKANEATRDIPVIFVTARSEVEDETRGFEVGGVDYITKPISPPIVKARVRTHLALRQARLTLAQQNKELIEAARLREDVDHIMRHDLKGPLTGIIGFPAVLLMDPGLKPAQIRALKYIEESGYSMLNLINLSLDLLKMEQGAYELDPQPVNLVAILWKIFRDQEQIAAHKNLKMELFILGRPALEEDSFMVMAEELLAFSLFSNLIRNAVEASPENVPVRVDLERDSGLSRIIVFNHGAVPEEIRDRFFEKYVTAGKRGGTGLGTYSARLMAETLQGSIQLESSDRVDTTTILVRLPSAAVKHGDRTGFPSRMGSLGGMTQLPAMRVLVVEDDPHGRGLILKWLDHPSLTVEAAENGQQALTRMTSVAFDLVFMDVEMPVMDGLEAVSRFRTWEEEKRSSRIPVIALTAHDTQEMRRKLIKAGFTAHLSKPVTGAELHSVLLDPSGKGTGFREPEDSGEEAEGGAVKVDADFQGMVEDFLEDNRRTLVGLLQAPDPADRETIGRFGHTLAGTGRMYGLIRLANMGLALEKAVKEEKGGEVRSIMAGLAEYLDHILIEFVQDQ